MWAWGPIPTPYLSNLGASPSAVALGRSLGREGVHRGKAHGSALLGSDVGWSKPGTIAPRVWGCRGLDCGLNAVAVLIPAGFPGPLPSGNPVPPNGDKGQGPRKAPWMVKCPPMGAGHPGPGARGELHLPSPGGPGVVSPCRHPPVSPTRSSGDTDPPGWALSAPAPRPRETTGVRSGEPPEGFRTAGLPVHRAWGQRWGRLRVSPPPRKRTDGAAGVRGRWQT